MSAARRRTRRAVETTTVIDRTNGFGGPALRTTGALSSRPEELDGAGEAVAEGDLRRPAEHLGGAPDVDHTAPLLPRLGGTVPDLGAAPRDLDHGLRERVDVGLARGADVDRAGGVALEREQAHARDVAHEAEVRLLVPS